MIRKHIPNFITCLNIVSGSLAVIVALNGQLTFAVILILAAAVFDFLDGMAARLLKAYSPIGKDLDSLADMISFGLAPGTIMFVLLKFSLLGTNVQPGNFSHTTIWQGIILFTSLLIPVFSALRLAKFNIDTRQTHSFIGLPTPANAIFISSLALIFEFGKYKSFDALLLSPVSLLIITLLFSYLLVSEIPMFSLKFKNVSWKDNKIRIVFLVIAIFLISAFRFYGITATIISFILLSFLQKKVPETKKRL
jgi:CDP-diacylglycerol--serine O-phosphatidyltransferase